MKTFLFSNRLKKNSLLLSALLLINLIFTACSPSGDSVNKPSKEAETASSKKAKFEPADGECILFVGQELEAIGGLDAPWNDGYLDHFERPGGFTMYTNISPGDTSFGYVLKGLDGLETTDDWGDIPSNMNLQLADPDFKNMALAIGLWFVNHEKEVAMGKHDAMIDKLGNWIKNLGDRPVFLRIGYEFGGSWNHYDKASYIAVFQRIRNRYEAMGVDNVAYVWQSHGWGQDQADLESWYPGDDYVDWCGYSMFSRGDEVQMIDFAKRKGKPVFIAEATPTISSPTVKQNGKTKETILSNPVQAEEAWEKWFVPFFQVIDDNPKVVKAVNYINCHWKSHPMWVDNPTFQDVDARLQTSELISKRWKEKVSQKKFLHASEDLYQKLNK